MKEKYFVLLLILMTFFSAVQAQVSVVFSFDSHYGQPTLNLPVNNLEPKDYNFKYISSVIGYGVEFGNNDMFLSCFNLKLEIQNFINVSMPLGWDRPSNKPMYDVDYGTNLILDYNFIFNIKGFRAVAGLGVSAGRMLSSYADGSWGFRGNFSLQYLIKDIIGISIGWEYLSQLYLLQPERNWELAGCSSSLNSFSIGLICKIPKL